MRGVVERGKGEGMTFTRLDSGLVVPVEKPRKLSQAELMSQYNALHSTCPKCGHAEIEQTCIGYLISDLETHVDRNHARCCGCAWTGVVHDLVPVNRHVTMVRRDGRPLGSPVTLSGIIAACNGRATE